MRSLDTVRIVAVGDTHLFHDNFVVPDGDVFVHVGDQCNWGQLAELSISARWIKALPHKSKVIVAGNHDWPFVLEPSKAQALFRKTKYLQDTGALVAGLSFYGSPWQPEFFSWAFNLPRGGEALRQAWSLIPADLDVLITHGPPQGYGDRCMDGHRAGCELLLDRLYVAKPKLHLFGHIHDDPGSWRVGPTTCVNVTTSMGRRPPTIIDFNTLTREVTLV